MFLYRETEEGPRTLANTYEGPEPCPLLARGPGTTSSPVDVREIQSRASSARTKNVPSTVCFGQNAKQRSREATGPAEGGRGSAASRQCWTATKSDIASPQYLQYKHEGPVNSESGPPAHSGKSQNIEGT